MRCCLSRFVPVVGAIALAAKGDAAGRRRAQQTILQDVIDDVAKLKSVAPILNADVEQGELKIVGGAYWLTRTADLIAQDRLG